jgi:hypothetical protein
MTTEQINTKHITLTSDLALVNDLASLERYGQLLAMESEESVLRDRLVAATKTVTTFSRLLGRRLDLIDAKFAYTDGVNIGAPVSHPYFYEFVEHEISHNLFKSNFEAKKTFCEQYVLQVSKALAAFGTVMNDTDRNHLTGMVATILNVIEDHRVNSLWAMLYPGSYKRLEEHSRAIVQKKKATAHDDIIGYFLCVAYNAKVPSGVFDRFEPAMVASLKKVERKGPGSTFVIGKWLMTQIVSEMIRITKKLPPPPNAGKSTMKTDLDDMGKDSGGDPGSDGDAGDGDGSDGDGDAGDDGGAPSLDGAPPAKGKPKAGDDDKGSGKGAQPDDTAQSSTQPSSPASSGDGSGAGGGADWEPPKVDATPEERIDAFKKLLDAARAIGQAAKSPMQTALDRVNNDRPSAVKDNSFSTNARKLVADAYATDVSNKDALDAFLDKSEEDMVKVMDTIQEALEQVAAPSERDWSTRNVGDRVVFRDIDVATHKVQALNPDDLRTVARMKDIFRRVKNRNAKALTDDGVEIDVQALIAQRVSGQVGPVFRTDISGRGFKVLILTDRSSSMNGHPSVAVERAARILRGALKIQNVEMHSWGFHGSNNSVCISRIAPNIDVADSHEMPAIGTTPMATAIRIALNWLSAGYEKKHLILLTDGEPNNDDILDGKSAYDAVHRELTRASKLKVETTTLVIGDGIDTAACHKMFGNKRRWRRVKQGKNFKSLTKTLVDLVSTSVANHLKGG